MHHFQIDDMHCGHCVRSITQAVQQLDPAARLQFDLPARQLAVDTAATSPDALAAAIRGAGYQPVAVPPPAAAAADPSATAGAAPRRSGCCCG